jgi:nucleotide-binding universal stress UspA family protein
MPPSAVATEVKLARLLVATDFSHFSRKALDYALSLARAHGSKLYLAHVISAVGYTLAEGSAAMAQEAATRDMAKLEKQLTRDGEFDGIPHESLVSCGLAGERIREIAERENIDLLVVGTHGRTGLRKVVMGSIAEDLFRHSACPVMTVGPEVAEHPASAAHFHRILFPTNFSSTSPEILAYAIEFAQAENAQLALLHVLPLTAEDRPRRAANTDLLARHTQASNLAMQQMKVLFSQIPSLHHAPELKIACGPAAEGILGVAGEWAADLIVMSVRRGGPESSHLPGGTAHEVVCRATCPVVTFRH